MTDPRYPMGKSSPEAEYESGCAKPGKSPRNPTLSLILNPAVGNAGAAREAQFHCAAQLLRAAPNR